MKRPSLALCCILKNEIKNLPRLLDSVAGCFDEIHLTDTGSTDGSVEWIKENSEKYGLRLHHFTWVDDFSAARNASFEPATTDYVMWMDLDDVMGNREAFISWRDEAMKLADFWLATYHYALDKNGRPVCSFARERVVKRSLGFRWKYFVHEGMMPVSPVKKELNLQYASTWSVKHMRDDEDLKQDKSRNLKIFEKHAASMDSRMRYYYGKELFEGGQPLEAFGHLMNAAAADAGLELHDRIMAVQYACMSATQLNQPDKAISLAHQGLSLSPQRAEFFVIIADSLLKRGQAGDAIPYYEAASRCSYSGQNSIQGPIFQHEESYRYYPLNQLARIYANAGDVPAAKAYVARSLAYGPNPETLGIQKDIENLETKVTPVAERKKTTDIVISCPPQTLYEWDPDVYREKGIGGSETAAVEMADHLAQQTGRKVIVFNPRAKAKICGRVEYRPGAELPEYFRDNSPALHIAWRHTMKLSDDPMYVWCHDLAAPGLENHNQYEKVLCLSEFHKSYVKNFFGVPEEKIIVTRNGIDPDRFCGGDVLKTAGKVVWSSSPDRGLDRAMLVMDRVVKELPDAKLHVYYGFENMRKMGMQAKVSELEKMMAERPYVVFHGNVNQTTLTREFETACVWLYPTNFLETFCITAIEMLCAGVFPVVRNWGALPDTLKGHRASILDAAGETDEELGMYAREVFEALSCESWRGVSVDPRQFSWASVAADWCRIFGLGELCRPVRELPISSMSPTTDMSLQPKAWLRNGDSPSESRPSVC